MPQPKQTAKEPSASPLASMASPVGKGGSFQFANVRPGLDSGLKFRLPAYFVLFLVFSFSLFMYGRTGLDSKSLFKFSEYNLALAKLASPAFILFVLLLCLSIAIAAAAARKVDAAQSVGLVLALTLIPSLIVGLAVFPAYLYPYLAFSAAVVTAAFFGNSVSDEQATLSSAWMIASRATLVLLAVSCILAFAAVSQQRDKYFDDFFSGIAGFAPVIAHQGATAVAGIVDTYPITRQTAEQMYPLDKIRAQLEQSYPGFSNLSAPIQDAAIDQAYSSLIIPQVQSLKSGVVKSLRDYADKPLEEVNKTQLDGLKAQLAATPAYTQLYDLFPIAMALLVLSAVSAIRLPIQLAAALATYGAFKVF